MAAKRNATGLASAMPRASLNDEELVSQGCLPNAASLDMYVKYTQLWGAQSERGGQGEGRANNAWSDSVTLRRVCARALRAAHAARAESPTSDKIAWPQLGSLPSPPS